MSIMLTPYDTMACTGFLMKKTTDALEEAFVLGHLTPSATDPRVLLVEGGSPVVDQVPSFAHPLFINPRKEEQGYVVVDVRYFGRFDKLANRFVNRNVVEYDLAHNRAKLTRIWSTEYPTVLQNVSDIPMAIYASWVSEAVSRKFQLEPREQLLFSILAAYFYCCLFMEDQQLSEQERIKISGRIARTLRTSAQNVLEVIEGLNVISGVKQFCEVAPGAVGSIRLQMLNPGLLYTLLKGTWFGVNAPEIIATAVEHPPTWLSIVMASFKDRSFKNTSITKIAERVSGRANQGEQFLNTMRTMMASA